MRQLHLSAVVWLAGEPLANCCLHALTRSTRSFPGTDTVAPMDVDGSPAKKPKPSGGSRTFRIDDVPDEKKEGIEAKCEHALDSMAALICTAAGTCHPSLSSRRQSWLRKRFAPLLLLLLLLQ